MNCFLLFLLHPKEKMTLQLKKNESAGELYQTNTAGSGFVLSRAGSSWGLPASKGTKAAAEPRKNSRSKGFKSSKSLECSHGDHFCPVSWRLYQGRVEVPKYGLSDWYGHEIGGIRALLTKQMYSLLFWECPYFGSLLSLQVPKVAVSPGCRRNHQGQPSYNWTRYRFSASGRRHPHPEGFPAHSRQWVR